jgi:6-phosphogluconolactonase
VKKFELLSFATADELARAAASAWVDEIESANRAGKSHCVALSGGRITHKFFTSVVEQVRARKIGDTGTPSLTTNVHFFWADERCVPPSDPESNFRMASELLFTPLKIPGNQIHRLRGEDPPAVAVKNAESELRQVAPSNHDGQPVLDLILLGMGEDGHVASLFPDAPAEVVNCPTPFLFIDNSPKPPPRRISLSYAAIAVARQVWVLISGASKEKALRESLDLSGKTPLGRVIQLRPHTRIFSEIRPN